MIRQIGNQQLIKPFVHFVTIVLFLVSVASGDALIVLRVVSGLLVSFYFVGDSMKSALKAYFNLRETTKGSLALSVLLSFSLFTCVSVILALNYELYSLDLTVVLIGIIAVFDFLAFVKRGSRSDFHRPSLRKNGIHLLGIFTLFFGILIILLFRSGFPWPSMPGADQYTYLAGSNWIFASHGLKNLLPSSASLSLPSSYVFQVLIVSTASFIGIDPYAIFWGSPFLALPLYGLLVYGLSTSFTHSREQGFISACVALAVLGGESFLGPQYFFPSTLSVILFLLILNFLMEFEGGPHILAALTFIFLVSIYFTYYFPFIITLPIVAIVLLKKTFARSWTDRQFMMFSITLFFGMIIMSWAAASLINDETLLLNTKLSMLNDAYGIFTLLLFLAGIVAAAFRYFRQPRANAYLPLLTAYSLSLLIIYFLPPTSSMRTEIFARGFIALFVSFIFVEIRANFSLFRKITTVRISEKRLKAMSFVVAYSALVLLLGVMIPPYISYASNVRYWSNISEDEYLAARWVNRNTSQSDYILTDPSTGYIFRGVATRNSSTSFIIGGHTPSFSEQTALASFVLNFFKEQDLSRIPDYYDEFPKKPDLVVITTRTLAWVEAGNANKTFYAPVDNKLMEFSWMSKFSSPFFSSAANWSTVRIYRPTNASTETVWEDDSFSNGWSDWYLDGAYANHSSIVNDSVLRLDVQAKNDQDSWVGLSQQLPNISDADFIRVRYRVEDPCYATEVVIWDSKGMSAIYYMQQSTDWREDFFMIDKPDVSEHYRIGIVIWTKDALEHSFFLDYLLLGKII